MAPRKFAVLLLFAGAARSQTQLDLGVQAKNIDFSQAAITRPIRSGTSMPANCGTGEMFYLTNGTAGRNNFVCSAPNVWSVVGGDIASQVDAENGVLDTKLMTPQRTAQAIAAQCSLPSQFGNKGSLLIAGDTSLAEWTRQLTFAPAPAANLSSASDAISPARFFVQVSPASNLTLTSAPTIPPGSDGQFLVVTNVSSTNSFTLQDESVMSGSNLRLGGSNVTLAPRQSLYLVYSETLGDWVRADAPGSGSSGATAGGGSSQDPPSAGWDRQFAAARCQNTIAGAGFSMGTTNTPVATCQTGANSVYATLDWDDTGTKPVYDFVTLPAGSSLPTIKVDLGWSTTATTGSVTWQIAAACVSGNPDPAFGSNQNVASTASATANNLSVGTLSSLPLSGCSTGQQLKFRIQRDTTDSLTAPARLHYIRFYQ